MTTLGELAALLKITCTKPDLEIQAITSDSREVEQGSLFVAYQGVQVDGHDYIHEAINLGAVAVVSEKPILLEIPVLQVQDGRYALALLSAALQGFPSHHLGVIGVTGTDGKTTTCNLIHSILRAAGANPSLLSTVNGSFGDEYFDTAEILVTPNAPELQKYLRRMWKAGSQWTVLETTSHSLSQWRVAGVQYDIAVVTNVTHEHLDAHVTFEAYLQAKGRLLELITESQLRTAILNADDDSFAFFNDYRGINTISYGIHSGEVRATNIVSLPRETMFVVVRDGRELFKVVTKLIGVFNIYNCLAAITCALALDIDVSTIVSGVSYICELPGRMEFIERGQYFVAIVDFAHTPHALKMVLQTARGLGSGKVIIVIGSGGRQGKDPVKRHLMGRVASLYADVVIITADNLRSENLDDILSQIYQGCQDTNRHCYIERHRYNAIRMAVQIAEPSDVVIVCGKGHEQAITIGELKYAWDDRVVVGHLIDALTLGRIQECPPYEVPLPSPTAIERGVWGS